MSRSHTITDWDPENRQQWESGGEKIAKQNLLWSVVAEHVGFSVWSLWSVMVLFMPQDVYGLSTADKFLIGATAGRTTLTGEGIQVNVTLCFSPATVFMARPVAEFVPPISRSTPSRSNHSRARDEAISALFW